MRSVFNDFTSNYSFLLNELELDFFSLRDARIQDMPTLLYKCFLNLAPFYLTYLFHVPISKYYLRGIKSSFIVPKVATTTFQYLAISTWNSLPDATRSAPDLNTFKRCKMQLTFQK